MSDSDDLQFNPNERLVPANMERVRIPERSNKPSPGQAASQQPQRPSGNQRPQQQQAVKQPVQRPVTMSPTKQAPPPVVHETHVPEAITERPTKPLDSRFEDVFLPSGFVAYPFKQAAVRRFTVEELRAIVRARVSGNMRHLVRAVDNTLSVSVYDLTVGDFWFLMYWHRINSYKKTPFIITWACEDQGHIHRVEQKQAEPKSLNNLSHIHGSDLTQVEIEPERYRLLVERLNTEHGLSVRPQNIVDFLADQDETELIAQRREKEKLAAPESDPQDEVATFIKAMDDVAEDEERNFINRYATLLTEAHGATLKERAAFLNSLDPDVLMDLEEFLEVSDHGVVEQFNVKCTECGASRVIEQSLDALSFLPSLQRGGNS